MQLNETWGHVSAGKWNQEFYRILHSKLVFGNISIAFQWILRLLSRIDNIMFEDNISMSIATLSKKFLFVMLFSSLPSAASAYAWISEVKVTAIEVTYLPGSIPFYVDKAVGGCAFGSPLTWFPRGSTADEKNQNAQGVLATLLTAKSSGQSVQVYVIADGCKVEYLYIK